MRPVNARPLGHTAIRRQPAPVLHNVIRSTRKLGCHSGNSAARSMPECLEVFRRGGFAWPNCNGSVVGLAKQHFACATDTSRHGIFQMPPLASLSNQGSFPPPASPGFRRTTSPSAALPAPRAVLVRACHATYRTSRVAPVPLFHACCRHYPGGTAQGASLSECFRRRRYLHHPLRLLPACRPLLGGIRARWRTACSWQP